MKGSNAFCPQTGAPLSDDKHYPFDTPQPSVRAPTEEMADADVWPVPTDGELTNGARISTTQALLHYFRRCYETAVDDPDPKLVGRAAILLREIKRARDDADVWVWYALQERLDRAGFEVGWMHGCAELMCPHCESRLRFEQDVYGGIYAYCGSICRERDGVDVWPAVIERVRTIYNALVEEDRRIETVRVLDPEQ